MEYNNGNYNKYMSKNILKRKMLSKFTDKIISFIKKAVSECEQRSAGKNEKLRILDAGCGEGFLSGYMHDELGNQVDITGLEYTSEALKIAKERNKDINFIQGDIMDMPFEDNSFDIVVCTEVLEHLHDPAKALSQLLRVSKGVLIISVPNEPWFCLGNLLALKNVTRLGNPIDHINHWTYSKFASFLKKNSNKKWYMDKSFPWTIARCRVFR